MNRPALKGAYTLFCPNRKKYAAVVPSNFQISDGRQWTTWNAVLGSVIENSVDGNWMPDWRVWYTQEPMLYFGNYEDIAEMSRMIYNIHDPLSLGFQVIYEKVPFAISIRPSSVGQSRREYGAPVAGLLLGALQLQSGEQDEQI